MSRTTLILASLFFFATSSPAQRPAGGRAFAPRDWFRLTTVTNPAMSPDGRQVAFTVTTVRDSANRRHSEIWVAPVSGGAPARFTSPSLESSNPRWSPDGRYLMFTSKREGAKGTTWALRMDRPGGEAFELDSFPAGSVTRDRRTIIWTDTTAADSLRDTTNLRAQDPFSSMGGMARPPYGSITRPLDAARFDGRHVVDLGYKSNDRGFIPGRRDQRRWRASQIWMRDTNGGAKRALTRTTYSHRDAVISPDGKWIAFTADPRLRSDSAVTAERDSIALLPYDVKRDNERRNDADIFLVPTSGGEVRKITSMTGTENTLSWSPDGRRISFLSSPDRTISQRIYSVDPNGGNPTELMGEWTYEPDAYTWMPGGDIMLNAAIGGRTALYRLNPATRQMREVIGGRRRISGFTWDADRTRVAYVSTSLTRPGEIFVANADGSGERQLTRFNDAINSEIAWSDAERFTYRSVGDLEIEGWLMKPYGYTPGTKYPLVLYIHGGPHSAYGEGWFDEFQNIAAAGMWVLFTNPRGSSGYGAPFTYSTRGKWGGDDYQDLMRAVDVAARRPDVDSTRMGVTGGSYGGFMTAWVTTKTNRFKAAQADRMISNWNSWYGSSDAQGLTEWEFYGKPWDNAAMYDTLSPIRFVSRVKTPTLIVQSEEDFRTPMGDAEQWFLALRKRGVPVEFVRYPRSTHELSRSGEPWLLVDRLGRLRQWFTYWLKETPARGGG